MALKKKPVTGMKDILPKEMAIRDYVIRLIKETYGTFGFTSMETPCVEHIENLNSKQGGENEKLIFKILKRGEKLKLETAEKENDLVDSGLRYDLTVPLCRYYSNNANELPSPFKALQMGNVWRADRPQRGRYRQFMQCDIDILGEPTNLAEIELILATTTLLGKLDFKNFTIRINDRRILKAMAAYSGFPEESYDTVFIILDKMDKIGFEGVAKELEEAGFAKESVEKYLKMFEEITPDTAGVEYCREKLEGFLDKEYADGLKTIIDSVNAVKTAEFKIAFDPTAISSLYGGRLRRKPAAFVRNTMGRRIMIISSAARKWREKLYTFRGFYITGGSTALPPQTIRQASCTRMRPEKRQLRETLRAAAKREPSHCVRIMASTM